MSYKGILFDFDGVVVKSMEQHFDAWQKAFAEKGIHITADEFFIMEGQGIDTISRKIGAVHGLSAAEVAEVKERKVNHYNQYMTIEFYDYFLTMLKSLHQRMVNMGVVTGGTRDRVLKIVDKYFNDEFACIVTSDDTDRGKPYPDPFLRGAELLRLKPQECIVIENAPLGIRAAKEAGMTVIAITTTLPEKFLNQADFVYSNFKAIEQQLSKMLR